MFADGDRASLVAFRTAGGTRLAWQTLTTPGAGQMYSHVVDATTGRVVYRRNLVQNDHGKVWRYWPGSPKGGTRQDVDFTRRGWLPSGSPRLAGNNTHVWSDVNDDNRAQATEEVGPGARSFIFPFTNFNSVDGPPCSDRFKCSWASGLDNSWQNNRKQNAVQVFYYVNRFHDHLRDAPIGFTRAAGNFEAIDDDAVQAQPDDGATTAGGHPDANHVDNANMATPSDGIPPIMQMYLFNDPADPTDPFLQSNGGDEADVVYHEYTHGLSNRLVIDPSGNSTLGNIQAGAMGEAWSDWYAMDFLNNLGLQRNTAAHGEVRIGEYVGHGLDLIRTQPMDCPVGSTSSRCHGTRGRGTGRLHLRGLRPDPGRPGGARRRRDLGRDPLAAARQPRQQGDRVAGHPGHGALPRQPVVPGRAQRDPPGRHGHRQGSAPGHHLEGLRQARHGVLRGIDRRRRHRAGRGLLVASGRGHADRVPDRHGSGTSTRPHRRRT